MNFDFKVVNKLTLLIFLSRGYFCIHATAAANQLIDSTFY